MSNSGRNDPCHCGSGKKYKKCCWRGAGVAQPRVAAAENTEEHFIAELRPYLDEKVDRALARLESGAGRAVEPEIKALLQKYPRYHQTNYAMGVYLATITKDPLGAMPFFEKAVQIFPPFAEAHFNLATAARLAGDVPKMVRELRATLRYAKSGGELERMAQNELDFLEKIVLEAGPFTSLDAYMANAELFDEAFQCLNARDFEKAAQLFRRVLADNPNHVQSFGNLALALAGLGQRAAALKCLDRALELDPGYEPAIINRRGIAQMREGEPFSPAAIQETHNYSEKLNREKAL